MKFTFLQSFLRVASHCAQRVAHESPRPGVALLESFSTIVGVLWIDDVYLYSFGFVSFKFRDETFLRGGGVSRFALQLFRYIFSNS